MGTKHVIGSVPTLKKAGLPKLLPKLQIGVATFVRRGKTVLMGRRIGSHGHNTWSFPGGHIDPGETPEQAARREVLEEAGIDLGDIAMTPVTFVHNHFVEDRKRYVTLYFEARIPTLRQVEPRIMEPNKCAEWKWAHIDKLPEPLFAPNISLLASGFRFS